MAMSGPRRCVLCEWTVEMVDRKLQENPYINWKSLAEYEASEDTGGGQQARPKPRAFIPPPAAPPTVPMPPPWRRPPADPSQPATSGELSSEPSDQVGARFSALRTSTPGVSFLQRGGEPGWDQQDLENGYNADMLSRRQALARTKEMAERMHKRATNGGKDTMPDIALPDTLAAHFNLGTREVPAGPIDTDGSPYGHEAIKAKLVPETKPKGFLSFLGRFLEMEGRAAQAAPVVRHPAASFPETDAIGAATSAAAVDAAMRGITGAQALLQVDEAVSAAVRRVREARRRARAAARRAGMPPSHLESLDDEAASAADAHAPSLLQRGGGGSGDGGADPSAFRIGDHLAALDTPALDRADDEAHRAAADFARRYPSVVGGEPVRPAGPSAAQLQEQQRFRSVLGLGPAADGRGADPLAAPGPGEEQGGDDGRGDFLAALGGIASGVDPDAAPPSELLAAAPPGTAQPAAAPMQSWMSQPAASPAFPPAASLEAAGLVTPQAQRPAFPAETPAHLPPAPAAQPYPAGPASQRFRAGFPGGFASALAGKAVAAAAPAAGLPPAADMGPAAPAGGTGIAAAVAAVRQALDQAPPGDGAAPGSEAGDFDSGYSNVNSLPSDPEDAAFRPEVVHGGSPEFGTTGANLRAQAGRSMAASQQAGRWSSGDQKHLLVEDPAALNYAAGAPVPSVPNKVSEREHARMVYRLDKTAEFFKTYHHVMDALEDVCEGQLPREIGAKCTNVYARVQKLTMWMMHGYQPDEICIKMWVCKESYFQKD